MSSPKPGNPPARIDESLEMRATQAEAADRIEQQPNFDASHRCRYQTLEHFLCAIVSPPDIKLDVYMVARFIDPLPQRSEEFGTVNQQTGLIGTGYCILIQFGQ